MEKSYTGRYPEIKDEQFDFTKAVVSMLNCRRYLESEGFGETFADDYWYSENTNSISGTVVFPDGSTADSRELFNLKKTSERDSLLERMIDKKAVFKRHHPITGNYFYDRSRAIRTSFGNNEYEFKLSVADTTREKAIIPVKWFLIKPRCFGFKYNICLTKGVITDSDLKDFEKYKQGLSEAAKSDVLVNYSLSSVARNTSAEQSKSEVKTQSLEIFDPWKVKIEELGSVAYGGRK